ncbi:hypothetical protein [Kitasatospora sp. NPDC088346]
MPTAPLPVLASTERRLIVLASAGATFEPLARTAGTRSAAP